MTRTVTAPPSFDSYLSDLNRTPLLSHAEEKDLAARVLNGDAAARDRLVSSNLRLVVNIARGYAGKGVPIDDLVSEGNLGLLRAAEGYDPDMNTRFSTYAAYWINQSIRRGIINTGRTVRVPAYLAQLVGKWGRTAQALAEELGRPPSRDEVAGRLGLSAKKAGLVADAVRVARTQAASAADEDGPGDTIADWRTDAPGESLQAAADLSRLSELLGRLSEREATVLRLRYGLGGQPPMTLKDIGMKIGLTRERVRQIENEALTTLNESFEPAPKEVPRSIPR